MLKLEAKHLVTGEELTGSDVEGILALAGELLLERKTSRLRNDFAGRTLALVLEKPSLRTHASFATAVHELGGHVIEPLAYGHTGDEPEDAAKILSNYVDAIVVRPKDHVTIEKMAQKSAVPVINGRSPGFHPSQTLADLFTLRQHFGSLKGLELAYVGDGNNVLQSLLLLAPLLGVRLKYACPLGHEPSAFVVKKAKKRAKEGSGSVEAFSDPVIAVTGANAVYTAGWTTEGEAEAVERFQLNEEIFSKAAPSAVVMHSTPLVRGKEISEGMVEHPASVVFRQSESRLHVQKALLLGMLRQ